MTNKAVMAKRLIEGFIALMLGRRVPVRWSDHASLDTEGQIYLPTPKTGDPTEVALLTRLAVHEGGHKIHTEGGFAQRLSSEEMALFNALEDPRMESAQSTDYPGASVVLSRGLGEMLQTLEENMELTLQRDPRRAVQLDLLVRGFLQVAPHGPIKAHGPQLLQLLAPAISGQQREAIDEAVAAIGGLQNSRETEELARSVLARLRDVEVEPPPPTDDEGQDEEDEEDDQDQQDQPSEQDSQPEPDQQDKQEQQNQQSEQETAPADECAAEDGGAPAGDDGISQQDARTEQQESDQQGPKDGGSEPQSEGDGNRESDGADHESSSGANAAGGEGPEASDAAANEVNGAGGMQAGDTPQGSGADSGEQQNKHVDPIDLGTLLREVLVARYGAPSEDEEAQDSASDGDGDGEGGQTTDEDVERLGQMLAAADADSSLEELLEASLAVLKGTGGEQGQPSDGALGLGAGMSLAFETSGEASVNDSRLQGVQSRLVTVLQRELQDRRRRPMRPAHAGQRVLPQRFWRLGTLGDTKIFAQRRMAHGIEAAATLLLDSSGSMHDTLGVAAEITMAFSLALQRLGVRTKVVRFPGTQTVTETLQRFGESPRACMQRCASLVADGGTPVGAAVEIERQALMEQRRLKNFLAVITDDGPGDEATLLAALAVAYTLDVMVVGVGIGCDIRPWIPNSVSVSAVTELPDALGRLFREKLSEKLAA